MKTRYLPAVKKYIRLLDELPEILKNSAIKEKFIYEKLGMSKKTWHNRKKLKNWTPQELLIVLQLTENQELTK